MPTAANTSNYIRSPCVARRFWVVFGFMSVAAIIVWAVTLMKPRGHRANGLCSAVLLTTAAFAYYAMVCPTIYSLLSYLLLACSIPQLPLRLGICCLKPVSISNGTFHLCGACVCIFSPPRVSRVMGLRRAFALSMCVIACRTQRALLFVFVHVTGQ